MDHFQEEEGEEHNNHNSANSAWDFDDDGLIQDDADEDQELNQQKEKDVPLVEYLMHVQDKDTLMRNVQQELDKISSEDIISYFTKENRLDALFLYTLETEIPRMEYTVTTETGDVLEDKEEIIEYIKMYAQEDTKLLIAAANQSILADIMAVLLKQHVVEPQFMATAVATSCMFHIDLCHYTLQAKTILKLSMPTMDLGELEFKIMMHQQDDLCYFVRYHLADHRIFQKLSMEEMQQLANEYQQDFDHLNAAPQDSSGSIFNMRDAMVSELLISGSRGFQSAWQQLQEVTNVQQKVDFLKSQFMYQEEELPEESPQDRPTPLAGMIFSGLKKQIASIITEETPPPRFPRVPDTTSFVTGMEQELHFPRAPVESPPGSQFATGMETAPPQFPRAPMEKPPPRFPRAPMETVTPFVTGMEPHEEIPKFPRAPADRLVTQNRPPQVPPPSQGRLVSQPPPQRPPPAVVPHMAQPPPPPLKQARPKPPPPPPRNQAITSSQRENDKKQQPESIEEKKIDSGEMKAVQGATGIIEIEEEGVDGYDNEDHDNDDDDDDEWVFEHDSYEQDLFETTPATHEKIIFTADDDWQLVRRFLHHEESVACQRSRWIRNRG